MQRTDSLVKPWCWERLKAGGEGDDRGWDGWVASPTRWTWVWASSRSWWWTGRPGGCSPWGRKESDTTERLNWTEYIYYQTPISSTEGRILVSLIILYIHFKKFTFDGPQTLDLVFFFPFVLKVWVLILQKILYCLASITKSVNTENARLRWFHMQLLNELI